MRLTLDTQSVSVLHLRPGYISSVRLPEDVSSVVLGNPGTFTAEHSEAEPRLVFLKPTTASRAETNALITTRTGHEISLHLVSTGNSDRTGAVDFVLQYDLPHSVLLGNSQSSFVVGETKSLVPQPLPSTVGSNTPAINTPELLRRQRDPNPHWQGKLLQVAVGRITEKDQQMTVEFSVLNASSKTIELLPPQIQLAGTSNEKHKKTVKADPVPIKDYTMTIRRLPPGAIADAVVVFDRPSFKESREQMLLQVAQAEGVDQPVLVPVAFVAPEGESR
ncbi:MAG TPA: hypothetical protein VE957_12465 [Terriglobales bacterium]|nr:hypothetical protein [Terriglobales bacterium]